MCDLIKRILFFFCLGIFSASAEAGPRVTVVRDQAVRPAGDPAVYQRTQYIWKKNITSTVFWIGEKPTQNNPTPNNKSSWDQEWMKNYGGYDNPDPAMRNGYLPRGFTPKLNPFYVALPYNDVINHRAHKPEAERVIPWFQRKFVKPGTTVCRGRWIQIYANGKYCFAQWEDCGPFVTDDWEYVFGNKRPKNNKNKAAGIDLSPAVRDYLGLSNSDQVHWRFAELSQVTSGPWTLYGDNNPFVNQAVNPDHQARMEYMERLRQQRDRAFLNKDVRQSR